MDRDLLYFEACMIRWQVEQFIRLLERNDEVNDDTRERVDRIYEGAKRIYKGVFGTDSQVAEVELQ